MEIRKLIINNATAEIGQGECPINSNKTKYGKWFGLDGVAWCGIFVSWIYNKSGVKLPNIGFTNGFAGCITAVQYFRKTKQITLEPKKGDLVFYDFNSDGRHDHVGIFIDWIDANHFEAIEGNTSLKNQNNGGKVMRRIRTNTGCVFVSPFILKTI